MIVNAASRPTDAHITAAQLVRILGSWKSNDPSYLALAAAIRLALLNGSLSIGARLPSERDLAAALQRSRTMVAMAYARLRDDGYLISRRGSGSVLTLPTAGGHGEGGLHPSGEDHGLVDLRTAAPPAPVGLRDAISEALSQLPRYLNGRGYEPQGLRVLREAIALRYTERGAPTLPEQILVTTGAQHALHLALTTYAGPGDRVVIQQPTYPNAITVIRGSGARAVPVPVTDDGVDIDMLDSVLRQTAPRVVYLITDFHNPTGVSIPTAVRVQLRQLISRHQTTLLADESMAELALEGTPEPPLCAAGAPDRHLLSVGSAAKTFWGGLRVGWIRGPQEAIARLTTRRVATDVSTSVLDQLTVAVLLRRLDQVLPERQTRLRESRDTLLAMIDENFPAWKVRRPSGGLVAWVDLGEPVATAFAAMALRQRVLLAAGPAFGIDGAFEQYLRLSFGDPLTSIRQALPALASAWDAVHGPGAAVADAPLV